MADDIRWLPAVTAATRQALNDPQVRRRLRLWFADCLHRILPSFEDDHPGDGRVADGIRAVRGYALGELDDAGRAAAMSRVRETETSAREYAWATAALVADALGEDAANKMPWLAYQALKIGSARHEGKSWEEAWPIEACWQLDRLREHLADV